MSLKKALVLGKDVHLRAFDEFPEMVIVPERTTGSGSFGVVYQAKMQDGTPLAIKKVLQDRRYKNRELQILREVNHPNCLRMLQFFYTPASRPDESFLNIVTLFYNDTLYTLSKRYTRARQPFPLSLCSLLTFMMLRGMASVHAKGICHRDIKPQNVLVNVPNTLAGESGKPELVICDFGSAKHLIPTEPNVSYICSRYYRAPELIFGATHYAVSVDIWSIGCVVAELILGRPLFPGESGVDQLVEVIRILGTPSREEVASMNASYKDYRLPTISRCPWERVFKPEIYRGQEAELYPEFIKILDIMLKYRPTQRPSAGELLTHPFFTNVLTKKVPLPPGIQMNIVPLLDSEREYLPEAAQRLINQCQ